MNPRDKKHEPDMPEAEDIERLYSGLSREEPPAELDARILAQARQAVKPRSKYREWFGPWQQPIAVAAVLVLSFTLLMLHPSSQVIRGPAPGEMADDDAVFAPAESTSEKKADAALAGQAEAALRETANKAESEVRRKIIRPPAAPAREFSDEAAILDRRPETDALSKPAALRLEAFKQAPAASSDVEEVIVQGLRTSSQAESEPGYRRNPERWWTQILALLEQGELDEARDEYALLKSQFPDFTPPDGPPDWY